MIENENDDTGGFHSENDEELLIDHSSDSSLSNDGNQSFSKNSNKKSMNRRKQLKPNRISSMQLAALQQKQQKIEEEKKKILINEPEEGEVDEREEEEEDDEADSSSILKLKERQASISEPGVVTESTESEAAYCNLCKKGFCNKYFLKSHMSNKHGGLFEPTSTVYLGSTGSMITHFKYSSSPKKQHQVQLQDNQFTQDKFKLNETPSPSPPINIKQHQENDNSKFNGQETTLQTLLTEDYCDSCQKHFCNKYYLRKHKLDVHGIVIDNNIKPYKKHDKTNRLINKSSESTGSKTENQTSETVSPISSLLIKSTNNLGEDDQKHSSKRYNNKHHQIDADYKPRSSTPQPIHQNGATNSSPSPSPILNPSSLESQALQFGLQNPNFMLVNPYMMQFPHLFAKHAAAVAASLGNGTSNPTQTDLITPLVLQNQLLSNPQLAKGLLGPPVSGSNFDLFFNKMNIQQPNVEISPPPPPPPPSSSSSSTQNKTKNTEEFVNCNFCSKSFCSVDFLKLHLINKHGINDHKAIKQENGDSNEIRYELKLHDSNSNTETFCFICEKDFSTKNSLKTHMNQKHSVSNENQKSSENDVDQQLKSSNDESNQMNASGKCLDKVVCNICNKQLCNKYFLRTHKAKVHGIKYELVNGLSILSGNATSSNGSQNGSNSNGGGDDNDDDNMETNGRKRKHEDDIDDDDVGDDEEIQDASSQVEDEDEKENKDVKKQAIATTPLPSSYLKAYCELCNKELCNKYFLKSHMLNAHNINIDNDNESQTDLEPASTTASFNRKSVLNKKQQKIKSVALESSSSPKNELETKYSTNKTDNNNNNVLDSTQKMFNELYRSYLPPATPTSPQPQNQTSKFDMQPFLIESKDKKFTENFVPCLVYLPVKNRIQSTIQLQLQLKPLDQTNLSAMTTNDHSNGTKRRSNSSSNSPLIIDTDEQLNDNSISNEERKTYLPAPISSS